ncbi:protein kinase STUNTED-like isoform X3 [Alnus glutinosa]|uniref:protein kinase STUNTED-like isoform X3 n=1 Tax=Alnus glutinosa TaxID=3517 RepID=UPI002D77A92E|nr:protein kinase STUNTED-like isoform X3 [Alnus glutinosa]
MTVEEEVKAVVKKNVLVSIQMDSRSRELLSWALVKVADPGDCVVAVHVCRCSDQASKNKNLLDGYLEVYEGLCSVKKVDLSGHIFTGSSVRKVLVREAKSHAAVAVVVGISKQKALGGWTSMAKYCTKRLPSTTDVLAIHNGKIVFGRFTNSQLPGLKGDLKPSFSLIQVPTSKECQSEFGDSEAESEISISKVVQNSIDEDLKDEVFNHACKSNELSLMSTSIYARDPSEQRPLGWPLLRRASSSIPQAPRTRNLSVVQWVMSLPDRSPQLSPQCSTIEESPLEGDISEILDESIKTGVSASFELPKGLEHLLKTDSSVCKWFSHEVLKTSTSQFSSENMIGKGGCKRVYKGMLPDGKPVAVKILKSSKEAWKDFACEVDIISSLKHKHITALLGACMEDNALISVYDFLPRGSLEENLHGKNKDKSILSWEVRFNIAVGIAEALNYLHNECSRPVIHRDVKSSNILLSNGLEPQLSDFGLAIWGPTNSSFVTQSDVLGTFGYLAPEYFMYGKVSDKIDVYAFGVVLLELISGRKPISSETPKGQESLVMWAKPIIESEDVKGILDPNLDGKYDEVQLQRMVLAATLCITRAARLRPKMSQILKLLKGDKYVEEWDNSQHGDLKNLESQDNNDDEVYPNSSAELHLSLALLDVDDDTTSYSSLEQSNILSSEEYLKGRCSRSSSFD